MYMPKGNTTFKEDSENENAKQGTDCKNAEGLYKGSRVELDSMDDPQAPPQGTRGTVLGVDDIGSIMVAWDNGSGLHVVYGEDSCHLVEED